MENLHGENLKLLKKKSCKHISRKYIEISDIFFRDFFSLSKPLCEIKQHPVVNEKSYFSK